MQEEMKLHVSGHHWSAIAMMLLLLPPQLIRSTVWGQTCRTSARGRARLYQGKLSA